MMSTLHAMTSIRLAGRTACLALGLWIVCSFSASAADAPTPRKPNIVFILADDMDHYSSKCSTDNE